MKRLALHLLAAFATLAGCAELLAQGKSPLSVPADRRYLQGPLAPEDFRGEIPDAERAGRLLAITTTDIKYDFRYQLSKKRDRLVGRLENLEVFAVLLADESWNKRPRDRALLDHEQGHFDLAQVFALRARAELKKRLAEDPLEAEGASELEVQQSLDREVRKLLRPFVDLMQAANMQYDRDTRHGTLAEAQAKARQEQRELLKRLSAEARKE